MNSVPTKRIGVWLAELDLSQYEPAFDSNDITPDMLPTLTDEDLRHLGVASLGHRKRLLAAIENIRSRNGSPEVGQATIADSAAQRRQLTVMFCDLVGSTELSSLLDPELLRTVTRQYQSVCAKEIARFDGFIAQYLGDGLLVYFGHPQAHEDDAQRSVRAGLCILRAMRQLNTSLERTLSRPLAVRIGIHTGLVVLGEVGEGARRENLALGETPNVAARLQALAAPDTLVISAATHRLVPQVFAVRSLEPQIVKGVAQPVETFVVLGETSSDDPLTSTSRTLTPLVGRNLEIGLLRDRWDQALDGNGQVVLLTGEPGVGKSRLLAAIREPLDDQNHVRLEARCSPYYKDSPLYPLIDLFPRALGWRADQTPEARAEMIFNRARDRGLTSEAAALICTLLGIPGNTLYPLPPMSPDRQKRRTLETLIEWVLAIAADQPLLVIIEDLHWMDPTTIEWLGMLLDQIPTAKILMVLTARPNFQWPWAARSHVSPVTLGRFTQRQTQQMIDHLTGHRALPKEVLAQIIEKTDGVPLFVEELTKMVLESDWLKLTPAGYELARPLPELGIPSTLQDSLMARLDRLATVKETVQFAATIGRTFSYAMLKIIGQHDDSRLHTDLAKMVDAEIVYQKGLPPDASYVFKHALIQDAAYQSLLRTTRQEYHQRIAAAMVEHFADEAQSRPEFVAHHFTQARGDLDAMTWWQRAGERAFARAASAEAIRHFQAGLDIAASTLATSESDRAALNLWLVMGNALIQSKGWSAPESSRAFKQAERICGRIADPAVEFRVTYQSWASSYVSGDQRTALPLAIRSLSIARELDVADMLINAHSALAHVYNARGEFESAIEHAERSLELYGPQPRQDFIFKYGRDPKVSATQPLLLSLIATGRLARAQALVTSIHGFAMQTGHPFMVCWGYALVGYHLALIRRAGPSSDIDEGYRLAVEQAYPNWICWLGSLRGINMILRGEVDAGVQALGEGIAAQRTTGCQLHEPVYAPFLIAGFRQIGDMEAARKMLGEELDLMHRQEQFMAHAPLLVAQGELAMTELPLNTAAAEKLFLQALEVARAQKARLFELRAALALARVWKQRGLMPQACDLLAPVLGAFAHSGEWPDVLEASAFISQCERL